MYLKGAETILEDKIAGNPPVNNLSITNIP